LAIFTTMTTNRNRIALLALAIGHFVNDAYSSTIYPLLPVLAERLRLTPTEVFLLAPLLNITSSLMQPVYGFLADRYTKRAFAVTGPAVTGLFISLIGVAPSYPVLVTLLLLAGVGIGSFHPQGAALAARTNAERRRTAVSVFSSSGTLGFALGPFLITTLVASADLGRTPYLALGGFFATLLMVRWCSVVTDAHGAGPNPAPVPSLRQIIGRVWQPLGILYVITMSRAALYIMNNNYLPFVLKERGFNLTETGRILTMFLLAGAVGGFLAGPAADRLGTRRVIMGTGLALAPLLVAGYTLSGLPALMLLASGAFLLMSAFPVTIAAAQEFVPGRTSTVSALMMGCAWGVGSLFPALCEPVAQKVGFIPVLAAATVLPLVTSFLALRLPDDRKVSHSFAEIALATPPHT
ncbi:MAG TPA: MFS transporter, partial [Blastocatellia bacterium]|nr:MFS transporter [Blastocatellia bacterium]